MYGYGYAGLMLATIIPNISTFAAVGGIICWIVYWIKISRQRKILVEHTKVRPFVA